MKTKNKIKAPVTMKKVKPGKKRKYTKRVKQVQTNLNWINSGNIHKYIKRPIFEPEMDLFGYTAFKDPEPTTEPEFQSLLSSLQSERAIYQTLTGNLFWLVNTIKHLDTPKIELNGKQETAPQGIIATLQAEITQLRENRITLEAIKTHMEKLVGD